VYTLFGPPAIFQVVFHVFIQADLELDSSYFQTPALLGLQVHSTTSNLLVEMVFH
jgi:hypothetical protein